MKDTWRAGLKSLEVERNVANLHHYAERSRHHTKDKQRLVLSVVAYDSLPGHHWFSTHKMSVVRFLNWCSM